MKYKEVGICSISGIVASHTCTVEYKSASPELERPKFFCAINNCLSVLLTSGLFVQVCDATMLMCITVAGNKKLIYKTPENANAYLHAG
ncbi:MAG: hypothetical protein RLZZ316_1482 [Bacteroidota bacterium]|jgi:hypothetical protein